MKQDITPTGVARTFSSKDFIVSKTDTKGHITYANDTFIDISGYTEEEIIGQPHNMVRHPDMPGGVFKLLWDTISGGGEIFAYVVNLAKNGDHYWVLAHVTPTFSENGAIIGYHSCRRVPNPRAVEVIQPLYAQMCGEEHKSGNRKQGSIASTELLQEIIKSKGTSYEKLIYSIQTQ